MRGDKLRLHRDPAPVNLVSGCLTLQSEAIARRYFILVSFSINSD